MSTPAERLKEARKRAGYGTVKEGAARVGVGYYTYAQHENGQRGFTSDSAETYARAFGVDVAWLLFGRGAGPTGEVKQGDVTPISRMIPVLGVVQAGAWRELVDDPTPEVWIPVSIPEYERGDLFALRVEGRSMDLYYADGATIIAVAAVQAGVRVGDHVVVRRRRGGLVETTLKEVVQEKDGSIALYPRSTDPLHQTPIRIDRARDADEGPEIAGVVIANYLTKRAGTGPLVLLT